MRIIIPRIATAMITAIPMPMIVQVLSTCDCTGAVVVEGAGVGLEVACAALTAMLVAAAELPYESSPENVAVMV